MLANAVGQRYLHGKLSRRTPGTDRRSRTFQSEVAMRQPEDYDPTPDALRANDPSLPQHERDAAWQRLVPFIEKTARRIARSMGLARRIPRSVDDNSDDTEEDLLREDTFSISEFEQEAVSHMYLRHSKFRGNNYPAWCQVVLERLAIDLHRRQEHIKSVRFASALDDEASELPRGCMLEPAAPSETGIEKSAAELLRHLAALHQVLEELAAKMPAPSAGKVDFFSVLMLYLRLRVIRLALGLPGKDKTDPCSFAEWIIPWSEEVRRRSFKVCWFTIADFWDVLRRELGVSGRVIEVQELCEIMNRLQPPQRVSPDLWNQWTKRARDAVEEFPPSGDLSLLANLM